MPSSLWMMAFILPGFLGHRTVYNKKVRYAGERGFANETEVEGYTGISR